MPHMKAVTTGSAPAPVEVVTGTGLSPAEAVRHESVPVFLTGTA
jgi:hypothetical protein